MVESLFVNHDQIKINVGNPIILNSSLILGFSFLILMTCRKTYEDRPLSILQTSQIKGLAIIAVIFNHLSLHTLEKPGDLWFSRDVGYIGVAVFLMISGFGLSISLEKKGVENFFTKRVVRVLVPLVLTISLEIFLNHVLLRRSSNPVSDFAKVFYDLASLDRNMWYVIFILFWYCITYVVFLLKLSNKAKLTLLFCVSLIVLTIPDFSQLWKINVFSFPLGCYMGLNSKLIVEKTNTFLKQNITFSMNIIIGIVLLAKLRALPLATLPKVILIIFVLIMAVVHLIYNFKSKFRFSNPIESVALLLTVTIVCFNYLHWVFNYRLFGNISHSFSAVLLAVSLGLFISLLVKFQKYSLFLNFVGEISYEVYLLHGMFMYSFDFILFRSNLAVTFFVYFATICLASLILKQLSSFTSNALLGRLKA